MTSTEILALSFRPVKLPDKANGNRRHDRPRGDGVYLLVRGSDVVYIGSGELTNRFGSAGIRRRRGLWDFDRAMCLPMPIAAARQFERALIRSIIPEYNRYIPAVSELDDAVLYWLRLGGVPNLDAIEAGVPTPAMLGCAHCKRVRSRTAMKLWLPPAPGRHRGTEPRWSCRNFDDCIEAQQTPGRERAA